MITYNIHVPIGGASHEYKRTIKCHDSGVNFRIFPEIETKLSQYRSTVTPYNIPAGSTAILKVKKADKTYVLTEGKVEHKSVYVEPHPQSFTVAGKACAEVNIYDKNMRRITTSTFYLDISKECASDCEQDSGSYVDILGEQIEAIYGAIDEAEAIAKHLPIIGENGNWWMWDVEAEQYEDSGMPTHGADGRLGPKGDDGASAYEIAVAQGFEGSEVDWLQSLHGEDGKDGQNGHDGKDGYTPRKGVDYYTEEEKKEILMYVDAQFGDVETALDSIIAMQDELIGGAGV